MASLLHQSIYVAEKGVAWKHSIHKCSNNAVHNPLSFVDTQRGMFLIDLSSRQYESHLCCHNITSNFSNNLQLMWKHRPTYVILYSLPGTVAPYWRLQGSTGSPASVAIFSDPSPFVCQQIWLLVAMNTPTKKQILCQGLPATSHKIQTMQCVCHNLHYALAIPEMCR